jgi:hypothetical protein
VKTSKADGKRVTLMCDAGQSATAWGSDSPVAAAVPVVTAGRPVGWTLWYLAAGRDHTSYVVCVG